METKGWLVFNFIFGILAATMGLLFSIAGGFVLVKDQRAIGILLGPLSILWGFLMLWFAIDINKGTIDSLRFLKVFGFWPNPHEVGLIKEICQDRVDQKLSTLARKYASACKKQAVFLNSTPGGSIRQIRKKIKSHQKTVDSCGRAFWRAHNLAKKAGFEVEPRHTNYL